VRAPKYARLSAADRDRIIEILRETKRDFAPRTAQSGDMGNTSVQRHG